MSSKALNETIQEGDSKSNGLSVLDIDDETIIQKHSKTKIKH